jgi:CubicO group peptidase (beta-lactamase class C family)
LKEQVAETIRTAVDENRLVGAVVYAALDGEVICDVAEGFFDREAGVAMTADAVFRMASVSKLYVAVATMKLVSLGKLSLDDAVDTYLPYFKPLLPDGSVPKITIRHLLTHTSGLNYGFLETEDGPLHQAGVSDGMDSTDLSLEDNLRRLAGVPLSFCSGSAWQYSLAFDVLGAVLEKIEHRPLPDVIHSLIVAPLGLTDTGFRAGRSARLAPPYVNADPAPARMQPLQRVPGYEGLAPLLMSPDRAYQENAFPSGGAGMVGSPKDLLVLLETLRTGGGSLLPSALVREMSQDQTGGLEIVGWPGWAFGLGFSILQDPQAGITTASAGTWQWGGAYGHTWFVDPVKKLSVAAFTNTALEGMAGVGRFPVELRDVIYREIS